MKSKGSTAVEILAFSLLTLRQGRVKNDFIENGLQYYFFCIRHRAQMTRTQNKRNEVERIIPHRDIRVLSLRALGSRMAAKTRANPSAPCSVKRTPAYPPKAPIQEPQILSFFGHPLGLKYMMTSIFRAPHHVCSSFGLRRTKPQDTVRLYRIIKTGVFTSSRVRLYHLPAKYTKLDIFCTQQLWYPLAAGYK